MSGVVHSAKHGLWCIRKVRKKKITQWNVGFMIKQAAAHDLEASLSQDDSNLSHICSVHELCMKCANMNNCTINLWQVTRVEPWHNDIMETIMIIHCTIYTQYMCAMCVHVTQNSALKQIGCNKSSTICLYSRLGICAHHASVKFCVCVCVACMFLCLTQPFQLFWSFSIAVL